jgi:predicted membrane-bound spermidine synthase
VHSSSTRGPFGFRLQSSSPVFGCLFTLFGLILALMVAVIGFFVALIMPVLLLIMRMVNRIMGKPATVQVRQSELVAIDVESTVLPREQADDSRSTTHEHRN